MAKLIFDTKEQAMTYIDNAPFFLVAVDDNYDEPILEKIPYYEVIGYFEGIKERTLLIGLDTYCDIYEHIFYIAGRNKQKYILENTEKFVKYNFMHNLPEGTCYRFSKEYILDGLVDGYTTIPTKEGDVTFAFDTTEVEIGS
jgi:hypothetical protein